jgi:hypothetical protein
MRLGFGFSRMISFGVGGGWFVALQAIFTASPLV